VVQLASTLQFGWDISIKMYETTPLPVLIWREPWPVILKDERRLRWAENKMLRELSGPKTGWNELLKEQLL
jgi:hypothetical protein